MKNTVTLRNQADTILYQAPHSSVREAIEYCIEKEIPLDGLALDEINLVAANLDGWAISSASFKNCNLRHANLSEATLTDCDFSGADLTDACLCYSDLIRCKFLDTNLELTDLSQAVVIAPTFSAKTIETANLATLHKLHAPRQIPRRHATTHPIIDIIKSISNRILFKVRDIHKIIARTRNIKPQKNTKPPRKSDKNIKTC
ncbi:MAG: pentapeptide repeat-containing protein [Pseudobdellovibrionaceae bacterium]|jgi:hypothetical protein|nr:pentapeptide repeat-containing protein [Pseudobdellovibrionaceae bacterium]